MEFAVINALLYIITLIYYWGKYKKLDTYFFLLLLYTATAVLCVNEVYLNPTDWDLNFVPFVYLFTIFLILISPLRNLKIHANNIYIRENLVINLICYIFIVTGLIAAYYNIPTAMDLISSGEWGTLRNELYAGNSSVEMYGSLFERIAKNINSYISPIAFVMAFYQLTKPKIPKIYTILLFVSIILPVFLESTMVASRGLLVILMFKLAIGYLIFKSQIPKHIRKYLYVTVCWLLAIFLAYTIAVSISRFTDNAGSSVLYYFSHSMLVFNDHLMSEMHSFANGKHFFEWFIDFFGGDSVFSQKDLGGEWGTLFYTIVGALYIDFGPVGTFFVSILVAVFMSSIFRKRQFRLSNLMVLIYYVTYIANGVMVIGGGTALGWLIVLMLYTYLRTIETKHIRIR